MVSGRGMRDDAFKITEEDCLSDGSSTFDVEEAPDMWGRIVSMVEMPCRAADKDILQADSVVTKVSFSCAATLDRLRPLQGPPAASLLMRRRAMGKLPTIHVAAVSDADTQFYGLHAFEIPTTPEAGYVASHYQDLCKLGSGSSSVVHRATRRRDQRVVVLKVMRRSDSEMAALAMQEYDMLRNISHPNIIKALDYIWEPTCLALVLEHFAGQSLKQAVRSAPGGHLQEQLAMQLFGKLLDGVGHLHSINVVHRDLKAENILVAEDFGQLKLIDFNTSRSLLQGPALSPTGTYEYRAPEVRCNNEAFTTASDIWSAGLCLWFMLHGRLVRLACGTGPSFGDGLLSHGSATTSCQAMCRACLDEDPALRPTATALLREVKQCDILDAGLGAGAGG